jgi:dihydropteroate synthase
MNRYINIKGKLYDFAIPRVMGILNITPDSFYSASRLDSASDILDRARRMIKSGVDIIDIGGYSSRPGAQDISVKEEIDRVRVALDVLKTNFPDQILSIDTFRAEVARFAIEEFEVDIVNDISAGSLDKEMFSLISDKNIPYVLMHMQGTPSDMQLDPQYSDVVHDLILWFSEKIEALVSLGVNDIIIDPGFGFGKSIDHNYELLARLHVFEVLERPMLVGLSRKSMIWKTLSITPEESLPGTIALNSHALKGGANIIRVHDIPEAVQTVKLYKQVSD